MGDPVTFQQAQQMPYLQAVIKEALRVHPAVGQPLSRIVPPGGAEIAGRYFPAGSSIGVNPWVLHRNPDVFGDDADAFRPDRWLDEDREEMLSMDQAIFTFGLGARTCIGKNISLLEMSKVIPQMYRQFDFVPLAGGRRTQYETENVWFVKQDFQCMVKARKVQK
ncbi:hypothetical protein LTR53_011353 [Teratosphaeriaceae sp. CCFEE 6253]|nr:hypothetical protein LTR53_011353 [Teratosphaeriaceae sp. CCFEE 6253]